MASIELKWGKQALTVSPTFLASIEEMGYTKEYDTDKKAQKADELVLPVIYYKELDSTGKLDISKKIQTLRGLIGQTGALYIGGVRLAGVYGWRLINIDVSQIHVTMGVLDSAKVELTMQAIAWPKTKKEAATKKAATKKTTKKTTKKSAKKSNSQIATEVINGKWGNGATRKKRLTAAGYNYNAIQKIVNARLRGR